MNTQGHPNEIAVIINRSAGCAHHQDTLAEIEAQLTSAGWHVKAVLASPSEIGDAVDSMVKSGARLVAVGGGDGTLSAVAALLVNTDIILGVLPMGTMNHFAKDLAIPLETGAAVSTLMHGRVAQVDVGEVNGRVFINNSSMGIYPDIVRLRERQRQRFGTGKWLAFAAAIWIVLRRGERLDLRIAGDDRKVIRRTPFAFIGNNEYQHAGLDLGSRKSLHSGLLSVYTTRRQGLLGVLRITLKSLTGRLGKRVDYDEMATREVVIETRRDHVRVANDGEVEWMTSPLCYRSRAASLKVMVPQTFRSSAT